MRYERLVKAVYERHRLAVFMKYASHAIVIFTALVYAVGLVLAFRDGIYEGIALLLTAAVPFGAVSLLRRLIDAPRPYELCDFGGEVPKKKCGSSFPSRHVFSIFSIGVAILPWQNILGIITLILGVILSALRVLLGIHFVRDAVAGGLIGIIGSVLGLICFGII